MSTDAQLQPSSHTSSHGRLMFLVAEMRRLFALAYRLAHDIEQEYPSIPNEQTSTGMRQMVEIVVTTTQRIAEVLEHYQTPLHSVTQDDLWAFRHDLLNPIGGIRGSAMLLDHIAHQYADRLTPTCHQHIDQLVQTGNDLRDTSDALVMPNDRDVSS
jgi:nitrogen-specific signal transduction histidine kinase